MTRSLEQDFNLIPTPVGEVGEREVALPNSDRLPESIPALALKVISVLGLLGAGMVWMDSGFNVYVASLLGSVVAVMAAGSGLQYLFDIRNHILRERRNDA